MTSVARSLVAAFAMLAVLLTAGVAGAARGQAAAAGEIVICAGGAAVTLHVDAEGNPTGPPHWCPDCVLTLMAAVAAGSVMPEPPTGPVVLRRASVGSLVAGRRCMAPVARGPPFA